MKRLFLEVILIMFFTSILTFSPVYAAESSLDQIKADYNASEIFYCSTQNEMKTYIYNCLNNYKGAVIAYAGEGYEELTIDDVSKIMYAAMQEAPSQEAEELWGNIENVKKGFNIGKNYALICLKANYKHTKQEMDTVNIEVTNIVNKLDAKYNLANCDDETKAKLIHNYLIKRFDYDYTYTNYDPYSAMNNLIDGKEVMVCQGYSLLFSKLANAIGLECKILISSTHSWNLVKIDGEYFQIDVTNDDLGDSPSYENFLKKVLNGADYKVLEEAMFYSNDTLKLFNISNKLINVNKIISYCVYGTFIAIVILVAALIFALANNVIHSKKVKFDYWKIYNSL